MFFGENYSHQTDKKEKGRKTKDKNEVRGIIPTPPNKRNCTWRYKNYQ